MLLYRFLIHVIEVMNRLSSRLIAFIDEHNHDYWRINFSATAWCGCRFCIFPFFSITNWWRTLGGIGVATLRQKPISAFSCVKIIIETIHEGATDYTIYDISHPPQITFLLTVLWNFYRPPKYWSLQFSKIYTEFSLYL